MMAIVARQLLVVDVETTGIDPQLDSIVEIGAALLAPASLEVLDTFQTAVRPESDMTPAAEAIHGMSAADLVNAPSLVTAIQQFNAFARPSEVVLCGHNVAFDASFLKAAYGRVDIEYSFDYHVLDIWSVAFTYLRSRGVVLQKYNLDELSLHYGLSRGRLHNALEDAVASASVLKAIYSDLEDEGCDDR